MPDSNVEVGKFFAICLCLIVVRLGDSFYVVSLALPVEVAVAGYHTHETPKMTKDKTRNYRMLRCTIGAMALTRPLCRNMHLPNTVDLRLAE